MHSIVGIAIGSFASLLFLTVLLGILYANHTRVINRGPFTVSQVLSFLASHFLEG